MDSKTKKIFLCVVVIIFFPISVAIGCIPDESHKNSNRSVCEHNYKAERETFFRICAENAKVRIEKSADVTYFTDVGEQINYVYTITNTSAGFPMDFESFVVQDDRVAVSCPSVPLKYGKAVTCTGTYTVTESDMTAEQVTNHADVDAIRFHNKCSAEEYAFYGNETNWSCSARDTASLTIPFYAQPALSLAKSVDPALYSGGEVVTYTYTLTNTGNVPLGEPFTIADDKVLDNWSCDPQTELQPGESMLCHADYLIDAGLRWTITNTAVACGIYHNFLQVCSEPASASVHFRQPVNPPEESADLPYCGDGVVNQSSEICDPPNGWDCSPDCRPM